MIMLLLAPCDFLVERCLIKYTEHSTYVEWFIVYIIEFPVININETMTARCDSKSLKSIDTN